MFSSKGQSSNVNYIRMENSVLLLDSQPHMIKPKEISYICDSVLGMHLKHANVSKNVFVVVCRIGRLPIFILCEDILLKCKNYLNNSLWNLAIANVHFTILTCWAHLNVAWHLKPVRQSTNTVHAKMSCYSSYRQHFPCLDHNFILEDMVSVETDAQRNPSFSSENSIFCPNTWNWPAIS